MLWHDKPHSSKECQEEEDNQGIAHRNGKAREGIVPKRASLSCWLMRLGRFRVVGIGSEAEQQNAAQYLEIEDCSGLFDEIHHEAHAQTRHHGVDKVTQCRSTARSKAVPTSLVEGALNSQHPDWPIGALATTPTTMPLTARSMAFTDSIHIISGANLQRN